MQIFEQLGNMEFPFVQYYQVIERLDLTVNAYDKFWTVWDSGGIEQQLSMESILLVRSLGSFDGTVSEVAVT